MTAAGDQARAALAAFDLYWTDGGPVDPAYGRPYELIRALLAERQEPAPSGMTREAQDEHEAGLAAYLAWRRGTSDDEDQPTLGNAFEAGRASVAAFPAVGQEPAARPRDRVTDEMIKAGIDALDPFWVFPTTTGMRAALEAALAHRPDGREAAEVSP